MQGRYLEGRKYEILEYGRFWQIGVCIADSHNTPLTLPQFWDHAGGTRIKLLFAVPNFLKHVVAFLEKSLRNDSAIRQMLGASFFGSRCINTLVLKILLTAVIYWKLVLLWRSVCVPVDKNNNLLARFCNKTLALAQIFTAVI